MKALTDDENHHPLTLGGRGNYLALGYGCNLFYYKAIQKCKHKYISYKKNISPLTPYSHRHN